MLLAYQGQKLERIMRFVLGLIVAVTVLEAIQANSEEISVSLASVDDRVTVGSSRNDCPDGTGIRPRSKRERNNREGRERTVVMDR